jgi:hypothetical protein
MNDSNDKPDKATATKCAACTEHGMRATLVNLEEFALMMSRHSSIRALEILEVAPPDRVKPPTPHRQTRPADIVPHPAARNKGD